MSEHPFRYRMRVRYAECDAQKVLFNARYGEYVDLVCIEFFRAIWGSLYHLFEGGLDYSLVRQVLEWRGPARFDDIVELSVWTAKVGTTSFTLHTEMRLNGAPEATFTAETTYVLVDEAALTKVAVPDDLRAALTRGAPGVVVDATGR